MRSSSCQIPRSVSTYASIWMVSHSRLEDSSCPVDQAYFVSGVQRPNECRDRGCYFSICILIYRFSAYIGLFHPTRPICFPSTLDYNDSASTNSAARLERLLCEYFPLIYKVRTNPVSDHGTSIWWSGVWFDRTCTSKYSTAEYSLQTRSLLVPRNTSCLI
jgi:hypothetical protein